MERTFLVEAFHGWFPGCDKGRWRQWIKSLRPPDFKRIAYFAMLLNNLYRQLSTINHSGCTSPQPIWSRWLAASRNFAILAWRSRVVMTCHLAMMILSFCRVELLYGTPNFRYFRCAVMWRDLHRSMIDNSLHLFSKKSFHIDVTNLVLKYFWNS